MTRGPDNGGPQDWLAVLEALLKGDLVAVAKVTAVITGWLAHYRAYDLRDSWEDLTQEVLIRLIKAARRGAIRERRAFITYVGTITRNLLIDASKPEGGGDTPEEPPAAVDIPELLDIKRIIGNLPKDQRRVVELVYFEGLTYEEAAKREGIPLGTLKHRLTQARQEIRRRLGENGGSS